MGRVSRRDYPGVHVPSATWNDETILLTQQQTNVISQGSYSCSLYSLWLTDEAWWSSFFRTIENRLIWDRCLGRHTHVRASHRDLFQVVLFGRRDLSHGWYTRGQAEFEDDKPSPHPPPGRIPSIQTSLNSLDKSQGPKSTWLFHENG